MRFAGNSMRILMLSSDPAICRTGSPAYRRMEFYSHALDDLAVVVLGADRPVRLRSGTALIIGVPGAPGARAVRAYRISSALCKNRRFDCVTAQGPDETGLVAYLLSMRFGMPFQLQIHTDFFSPWYCAASWKERARLGIARFLIRRASCIRAVSGRVRESLGKTYPDALLKTAVLPVYTNLEIFFHARPDPALAERLNAFGFVIASAGRFVDREKNFSLLIKSMPSILQSCPATALVLAGDGPDRAEYERLIREAGLGEHVFLTGWREDLASVFACADVFLLPSFFEGWGVAVLQAMAAGLAVVMTDVGLAGEIAKNNQNALIVPVNDAGALVSALVRLAQSPEDWQRFRRAARKTAEKSAISEEEYLKRLRESFMMCISR